MKKLFIAGIAMLSLFACGKKSDMADSGEKKVKLGVTYYKYDDNFLAGMRKDMNDIKDKIILMLNY